MNSHAPLIGLPVDLVAIAAVKELLKQVEVGKIRGIAFVGVGAGGALFMHVDAGLVDKLQYRGAIAALSAIADKGITGR
jgi:hypothetical protein